MSKFLYVFCQQDRDALLALGYQLLKGDCLNRMYVFINKEDHTFPKLKLTHLTTDTLYF